MNEASSFTRWCHVRNSYFYESATECRDGLTLRPEVLHIRMALTLSIPCDIDLAAIPLPEMENIGFFRFRTMYEKIRYSLLKFNAVSSLFICSASGSPTAATSSLPTRASGICILLYLSSIVKIDWTLRVSQHTIPAYGYIDGEFRAVNVKIGFHTQLPHGSHWRNQLKCVDELGYLVDNLDRIG